MKKHLLQIVILTIAYVFITSMWEVDILQIGLWRFAFGWAGGYTLICIYARI